MPTAVTCEGTPMRRDAARLAMGRKCTRKMQRAVWTATARVFAHPRSALRMVEGANREAARWVALLMRAMMREATPRRVRQSAMDICSSRSTKKKIGGSPVAVQPAPLRFEPGTCRLAVGSSHHYAIGPVYTPAAQSQYNIALSPLPAAPQRPCLGDYGRLQLDF